LNRPTGGSYILSSPAGSALALKNIFCTYRENDREIDGIITILNSAKERIENCIKELPEKEDFEHLEHFSKGTLPEIEDKMATIIQKLDICENEFTKDDKQLLSAEKRVAYLGDIFKGAASCKFLPKTKAKKPTLPTTKEFKEEEKRVWVVKGKKEQGDKEPMKEEKETTMLEPPMITNDKQIEEVKMLSETK
jgi:hypothetical protein